jgi:hypothetical protein
MNHRYILEPYTGRGSRHTCPGCDHRHNTFKRYIDTETGVALADHVGKCDRLDGCGYHLAPRHYFAEEAGTRSHGFSLRQARADMRHAKRFDTLPRHYVDDTAKEYWRNNFTQFLAQCFDQHIAITLASRYKIGTSKHWPGATIFWQIDINDSVRTGKIMLYNQTDGHRVKQPFNHITWAHTVLAGESGVVSSELGDAHPSPLSARNFQLQQCFFGEHLLHTDPFKTVAIAESEKTAVIASFFYPKYIWLAAGSLEGLSWDKCKVLKDRRVILFPDVNGYDKWRLKAREMRLRLPGAKFTVDNTLERVATDEERARGIDIADRWIEQLTIKP